MEEPKATEEVKKKSRDPIDILLNCILIYLLFSTIIFLPIKIFCEQAAHDVFWPMMTTEIGGLTEIIKSHPEVGDLDEYAKCMKQLDAESDRRSSPKQSVLDTGACLRDYAYHNELVKDRRAEGVRDGVQLYNDYMDVSLVLRWTLISSLFIRSNAEYPLSY